MTVAPVEDGFLPIAQAAARLHCAPITIRRAIARGELPAYRLGTRDLRVKVSDLDALPTRVPTVELGRTGLPARHALL